MAGRLAIIGGGIGGVATAYLCDADWSIDLFEAQPVLGGNAATVEVRGVPVDLGAETFHPATHPLYWELVKEIGADGTVVRMPGTLSVFDASTRSPRFVSTHPLRTPAYAWGLLRFIRASRTFLADNPSSEPTLGEWFETHPLGARFAREVLLPWLASLTSSNVETLTTQSMRAFLVLFAPAFPRGVFDAPSTFCSRIGLGGIVRMLADRCANLSVHLNAPVTRLERVHSGRATDGWFVETAAGRFGPYEHVVVNAPPYAAREFLTGATEALRDILGRYTYYAARMVIHEDPRYMPASQRDWCMHNAAVDGEICEATFWLGAYRTDPATGAPLRLFKSWATHRAAEPDAILAEREFRHLLLTPGALHAARELQRHQGVDGLHFVGHATTLTDLQETALWSAMKVAETLAPASPRLRLLQRRATQAGHAELDYRP